ncbi:hypothetical protein VWBp59 [Streptomyces phage VWB]|uniref:Uncharacterized protein n=1 Tax=Streptomyces phage VWB TaxID=10702 RepID=Q6VY90_9CAUD|nr:hypothetical protein VWBp59 [Streptomyces phage VWB]AAR29747.1 hypothetical protein [Streptomyces phage VWB]
MGDLEQEPEAGIAQPVLHSVNGLVIDAGESGEFELRQVGQDAGVADAGADELAAGEDPRRLFGGHPSNVRRS